MCGSGAMSWVKNQRMATPKLPSSVRRRSAHSACRSAGQSAFTSAQKYIGVPALDIGPVGAGGKMLGGHFPDGREHAKPRRCAGRIGDDEAVPGEGIEQIQRPVFGEIGDVHGCLDRPGLDEDRQRGQHLPLRVAEQANAPLDGRAQRALARGEIGRAGPQSLEAATEPCKQ